MKKSGIGIFPYSGSSSLLEMKKRGGCELQRPGKFFNKPFSYILTFQFGLIEI